MDVMLENRVWWSFVHEDIQELSKEASILAEEVEKWKEKFHDYAFIVFPAAKAYEGFLKTLFLDLEFISEKAYYGKRFRIGKALNPSLDRRFREKHSVYDKLVEYCSGTELPDALWSTWKEGRNLLFHWFPNERNAISYSEAKALIYKIFDTMDLAYKGCKIDRVKE